MNWYNALKQDSERYAAYRARRRLALPVESPWLPLVFGLALAIRATTSKP